MGGQHPVEQDTVGDCATEAAQPRSHGCHDDARPLREELPQLGDGSLHDVDRCAQLAGPDPDPELGGIEPEAVDLRRDPDRLMSVEGKDAHAELELRGGGGELCERLQAGAAGSSFDHSEWYPSARVHRPHGEVARESGVHAEPSA